MPTEGEIRQVGEEIEIFFDGAWIRFDQTLWPEGATLTDVMPDGRIVFFVPGSGWEDVNGVSVSAPEQEADVAAVLAAVPDAEQSGTTGITDEQLRAYGDQPPTVAVLIVIAKNIAAEYREPTWEPSAQELEEIQKISSGNLSAAAAVNAVRSLVLSSILPETQARAMKSYVAYYQSIAGNPPTADILAQIGDHVASGATDAQIAARVRELAQSVVEEAPEPYFETERRRVEASRATEVAQKSRSAEEQFDAALDAGDLDKARLIRNFLDEPSEWQIELLKMEYADNLPALKILFDYVDAIGRADVVPEEARALVEQPADADARLRMLDFAAWQKTQPPQEPTQGPPGFGGVSYGMPAAEATAEEQKRSVFGGVGDIPPMETAGQAIRRLDPDLAEAVALVTGEPVMRHSGTPIPSVPVLTSEMMASPIFQQALQTTKGTANEPIVKLLVDGIEWPLPASQYADFVKQRISWGETVEMPNREKGIWETLYVGDDGSIQVRPTVRPFKKGEFGERYFDDESVRFGRTGEQFVVPQRFTAEQIVEGSQFIPGGEQLGEEPPVFQQYPGSGVPPLAPFSLSQAEAGRPEGLPFTVTQETMDKIKSQQRIGLDPGEAHFVDPVTGQSGVMDFKTEADIEEFKKQRPGWVEVARTDPIPVAEPVFGPSRAEREATFIKEAQAFAPPPTFKKTPRPFGTPRFVTT